MKESHRAGEQMSTCVDVAEEQRAPLLQDFSLLPSHRNSTNQNEDGVVSLSSDRLTPTVTVPNQRLASLDVFRGLTVALMILVDDVGKAFPSINHSPWLGVTLADFVMPFFLFGVGVSVGLVFKKVSSKPSATKKVILRTIKLFFLGLLLQGMLSWFILPFHWRWKLLKPEELKNHPHYFELLGFHKKLNPGGYFHGRGSLTYGVDVGKIRLLGILQRISIGYFLVSISEIWLINHNIRVDSPAAFVRKYSIQWIFSILLCSVYLCLLYLLYVPNWEFEHSNVHLSGHVSTTQTVHCGVRGSLEPPCNAVGFIDRLILGEHHMYQRPVYRRTKECSVNSPDYGPLPADSPGWCLAPFDPEGILSSLMAAITCFVGLHFGHILVLFQGHRQRVFLWSMFSFPLLLIGYIMEILGIPLSKALYTLSYMCITAGASGLILTIVYYIVDIKQFRKPTVILQWMGMNALIVYALAACDIFSAAIQGFYWRTPENNLVDGTEAFLQTIFHSEKWGTLVFVMVEILFWGLFAGFLHKKGIYIKL